MCVYVSVSGGYPQQAAKSGFILHLGLISLGKRNCHRRNGLRYCESIETKRACRHSVRANANEPRYEPDMNPIWKKPISRSPMLCAQKPCLSGKIA